MCPTLEPYLTSHSYQINISYGHLRASVIFLFAEQTADYFCPVSYSSSPSFVSIFPQNLLLFSLSLVLATSCKLLFSFIFILDVLLFGWVSGWWRHSQPCHITRSLVDLYTCSKLHNQTNVLLFSFVFISVLVSQRRTNEHGFYCSDVRRHWRRMYHFIISFLWGRADRPSFSCIYKINRE